MFTYMWSSARKLGSSKREWCKSRFRAKEALRKMDAVDTGRHKSLVCGFWFDNKLSNFVVSLELSRYSEVTQHPQLDTCKGSINVVQKGASVGRSYKCVPHEIHKDAFPLCCSNHSTLICLLFVSLSLFPHNIPCCSCIGRNVIVLLIVLPGFGSFSFCAAACRCLPKCFSSCPPLLKRTNTQRPLCHSTIRT